MIKFEGILEAELNMEASVSNAIIAGVVGLFTGAVGSLIAPWVQWGIEKRRKRYEKRVELVKEWRELVLNESFEREDLLKHPSYGALRERLTQKTRQNLENLGKVTHVHNDTSPFDYYQQQLLKEIARIEKSWELD